MNSRLKQIRQAEKESHEEVYSSCQLYEEGSWLQKPIKTVLELVSEFEEYETIKILDLGGGIGRNCIPFARQYSDRNCSIECVDILDMAIQKLEENGEHYKVGDCIKGIVSTIEDYKISPNKYDLIMAISALEHIDSEESFCNKLVEIREGIKQNGIICLVMNSNVTERDKKTGEILPPQFEVNLSTQALKELLQECFLGWKIMKVTESSQNYDIPRGNGIVELHTNVVTYVVRKK